MLFEGQRDFVENQRGVSYEALLLPYLRGAIEIELHDPYIRMNHQGRNLVELLALVASAKDPADEVTFKLYTTLDDDPNYQHKQLQMLNQIRQEAAQQGLDVEIARTRAATTAGYAPTPAGASTSVAASISSRSPMAAGLTLALAARNSAKSAPSASRTFGRRNSEGGQQRVAWMPRKRPRKSGGVTYRDVSKKSRG